METGNQNVRDGAHEPSADVLSTRRDACQQRKKVKGVQKKNNHWWDLNTSFHNFPGKTVATGSESSPEPAVDATAIVLVFPGNLSHSPSPGHISGARGTGGQRSDLQWTGLSLVLVT